MALISETNPEATHIIRESPTEPDDSTIPLGEMKMPNHKKYTASVIIVFLPHSIKVLSQLFSTIQKLKYIAFT